MGFLVTNEQKTIVTKDGDRYTLGPRRLFTGAELAAAALCTRIVLREERASWCGRSKGHGGTCQ